MKTIASVCVVLCLISIESCKKNTQENSSNLPNRVQESTDSTDSARLKMIERNTPLNEEVDATEAIRGKIE